MSKSCLLLLFLFVSFEISDGFSKSFVLQTMQRTSSCSHRPGRNLLLSMSQQPGTGGSERSVGQESRPVVSGREEKNVMTKKMKATAVLEARGGYSLATHVDFSGLWTVWLSENCPTNLTSTLAGLTDSRASQRKAAVCNLLKNASPGQGAPWAVAALAARLGDNSACVREAAVKGLAMISEKGNRNVVLAMAELVEEERAITVRSAALQALTRVAERGDEVAVAPVLKLLRRVEGTERGDFFSPHLSPIISKNAAKALGSLAEYGDLKALKALHLRVLDDPNPVVREAAARALGSIANMGDRQVIFALTICLEDEDEGVRRSAMRSLKSLKKKEKDDGSLSDLLAEEDDMLEWYATWLWLVPLAWDC
mmetsp:Transcript_7013/g.24473  ORF Transcript_7013/g.24473 Transcript_7013/m.24473 type:complete len:368 (-) Transcript_7013:957-2060(-)